MMAVVQDSVENEKKCICSRCPSFPRDCKGEILYCARGESRCEIKGRGCVCAVCPVYLENRLQGLYFCDQVEVGFSKTMMRKKYADEESVRYETTVDIKDVAAKGRSLICSMGSLKKMPAPSTISTSFLRRRQKSLWSGRRRSIRRP